MKEYFENGKVIDIVLDSGKTVKVSTEWVEKSMKALNIDKEDTLLMWLEDNGYLENADQIELDNFAKANKPKIEAKAKPERKKVVREKKANPIKEYIISCIAEYLQDLTFNGQNFTNINIENPSKIITFTVDGKEFKVDLTEKRVKKV